MTASVADSFIGIDDSSLAGPHVGLTVTSSRPANDPARIENTSSVGGKIELSDSFGVAVNVNGNFWLNGGGGSKGVAGIWQLDPNHDPKEAVATTGPIIIQDGMTLKLTGGEFTELDAP